MSEILALVLAGVAGIVLGSIFFGGLWLTVHRGMQSSHAALWFPLSLLLRSGIALSGFYLIGHAHWHRLVACLLGFIIARLLLTRWLRPATPENAAHLAREHRHAS